MYLQWRALHWLTQWPDLSVLMRQRAGLRKALWMPSRMRRHMQPRSQAKLRSSPQRKVPSAAPCRVPRRDDGWEGGALSGLVAAEAVVVSAVGGERVQLAPGRPVLPLMGGMALSRGRGTPLRLPLVR